MSSATTRGVQVDPERLHQLEAAQVGAQGLRHGDRAVLVLVGLEDRDDRAGDGGQGAVEGGDGRRAVVAARADVEAAGLELGAVGRRGELAPALAGRDPRLAVELARRAQPEVARGGVDHAVAELELVEELLLPRQQPLVLGVGLLHGRVDEHLDLVEPVHPPDATRVLAVRAGLLAEARAEGGVAQRQRGGVEDLVGVEGRHRDLRGADQVEVLALDAVDVVGGLAQEAGALHGARAHQRRRGGLDEARGAGLVHGHVDQRQLELRADAGEEVEARAADLGAALEVEGAEELAELDVVTRLEVELARRADLLDDRVVLLAAGRRGVVGEVGDGPDRLVPLGLCGDACRLGVLHARGELLDLGEQRLLLVALRLGDEGSAGLLLGTPGLEVGDRPAPRGVGRQRPVDHVVGQLALGLGGAHAVGVVTEDAGIDHAVRLSAGRWAPRPGLGILRG